jgi:hypothetical protein
MIDESENQPDNSAAETSNLNFGVVSTVARLAATIFIVLLEVDTSEIEIVCICSTTTLWNENTLSLLRSASADTNSVSLCPNPVGGFENKVDSDTHALATTDDVPSLNFELISNDLKNRPNRTLIMDPVNGG